MKLPAPMKAIAERLLAWDRARVAQHQAEGYDCTVYVARQDLAEACLEIDTDAWPQEVRFLFMAVLEVTRNPRSARARVANVGTLKARGPALTPPEVQAFKQFAGAIGVIDRLKEAAPKHWGDAL